MVLFDLDGTLTDSGVGVMNSVAHAVAALGLEPLSERRLRGFVGPPLQDSFAALGLSAEDVVRAVDRYREYFSEEGLFQNELYEGVEAMLQRVRSGGARLGVATSKPTVFAERILDHFGIAGSFDHVVGAELDGSRRHKHEILGVSLARFGLDEPVSAVMVGDRAEDVAGAAMTGMDCIGAGWGYGEPGELEAAGAAVVVDSPTALAVHLIPPTRSDLTANGKDADRW